MRLRQLARHARKAPRTAHLTAAAAVVAVVGTVTPLLLDSAAAASASGRPSDEAASVTLSAPATVTRGGRVDLVARLTIAGVDVPNRPLQFVARAPGSTVWQELAAATTGLDGSTTIPVSPVDAATDYGVYYSDLGGIVRSATDHRVVHVVDLRLNAPKTAAYGAPVRLTGQLVQDSTLGLARQQVAVQFRNTPGSAWTAPTWLMTDSSGVVRTTHRSTRSFQVRMQFPGAAGLAASPVAVALVRVLPRPAISKSGFRFPFLNPAQVQSPSAWTLDQGVDMFAQGQACGAAAKLVAVGDGTVIQTGISGFGPTAPVIRMSSGPFKGRNVYYGHTGHIYVHVGQQVHMGQLVAQIGCGQVGYSAAPHLEIGVGEPGGPPCCPPMHATASQMYRQLVAALRS